MGVLAEENRDVMMELDKDGRRLLKDEARKQEATRTAEEEKS